MPGMPAGCATRVSLASLATPFPFPTENRTDQCRNPSGMANPEASGSLSLVRELVALARSKIVFANPGTTEMGIVAGLDAVGCDPASGADSGRAHLASWAGPVALAAGSPCLAPAPPVCLLECYTSELRCCPTACLRQVACALCWGCMRRSAQAPQMGMRA